MTMLRTILAVLLMLLVLWPVQAEGQAVLYAGLIKTKGYVVGSPLSASGLHRLDGDSTWTHLGWNHPRISGIASDPRDPDVLYLAAGNGVLHTMDGGQTWRIATGWEVTEAQDIAVDPNAPEHVYVATAYGVWRTEDGGATWAESNEGLPKTYTQTIRTDRTQAGRLFAGTWGGLYVSTDGAHSWTLAGADGEPINDVQQSAADPNIWLMATQWDGIRLSQDAGQTWHPPGALDGATVLGVAIDPDNADHMAAVGWDTGVYVSTDGGATWMQRGTALPTPHFYETVFDANVPGRLWVATVEHGVYYSDDLGQTWHASDLDGTLVFDMTFIESP